MNGAAIRYVLTHRPDALERYDALARRVLPEAGIPAPSGLRERAARVGVAYPLLAMCGDDMVAGICATVRDAGNEHVPLPEEEGTRSRLLGCHVLLARRFVWANHLCIDPAHRGQPILRELVQHLAALAQVFGADAVGLICKREATRMFETVALRYFGVGGHEADLTFDLPPRYRDSGATFMLFPTASAAASPAALRRVREHCERQGIPLPA